MTIDLFFKLNFELLFYFISSVREGTSFLSWFTYNPWLCQKEFVDPIMYPRP
jgi:hypothetical protein